MAFEGGCGSPGFVDEDAILPGDMLLPEPMGAADAATFMRTACIELVDLESRTRTNNSKC